MLAKDAGKRDRWEIGFPTLQLEKEVSLTCVPYYVPHTLRWPRGYGDCFADIFRAGCGTRPKQSVGRQK